MIARRIAGALLLSAALVCSAAAIAGAQFRAPHNKKLPSQITADMFLQMNTSSPGTVVTAAILTAGTFYNTVPCGAGGCGWSTSTTKLLVGASQSTCGKAPSVVVPNSGTYAGTQLYNSIEVPAGDSFDIFTWGFGFSSNAVPDATIAGCITMPGADATNHMDLESLYDTNGQAPTMQWEPANTTGCTPNGVTMELVSPTRNTACIDLTPGAAYWWSMNMNENTGVATLRLYTPAGKEVGTVSETFTGGFAVQKVELGNNEVGTSTTPYYFQNVVFDTTGKDPIF